jgi:hypothetical protein
MQCVDRYYQSMSITLLKPREYPLMISRWPEILVHLFFVARNEPVSCEKFQLKQSLVIGPILAYVFGICLEVTDG